MTKKQEVNAIYDRLCWMLKGASSSDCPPDDAWAMAGPGGFQSFIEAVNDVWHVQDAGELRLINTCYISNWDNLELVAEIIYDGGGRINRPMDAKKAKS